MNKYLIVGLGNPGFEYLNTKHNVGFRVIDFVCNKLNIELSKMKFNGMYQKVNLNNSEYIFAKPLTYMNLSGNFVREIINFYKIDLDSILIIYDDIDINLGSIRVKKQGSSGGQNGIKHIINILGSENIKRIRIGIGRPQKNMNIADYVLSNFTADELELLNKSLEKATNAVLDFGQLNFDKIMDLYNK